ncbi:unnamed protein product, partial [Nesidiocoris tenuis]
MECNPRCIIRSDNNHKESWSCRPSRILVPTWRISIVSIPTKVLVIVPARGFEAPPGGRLINNPSYLIRVRGMSRATPSTPRQCQSSRPQSGRISRSHSVSHPLPARFVSLAPKSITLPT